MAIVICLLGCGRGDQKVKLQEKVRQAVDKINAYEQMVSADNKQAVNLVKTCRKKVEAARGLLIEDDYESAERVIDDVLASLKPVMEGRSVASTSTQTFQFTEMAGDIRYKESVGDTWKVMDDKVAPKSGMFISTGIRSSMIFNVFDAATLDIHDQTQIAINQVDRFDQRLDVTLTKGFINYRQKKNNGSVTLRMLGHSIASDQSVSMECVKDPLGKRDYMAIYRGLAQWEGGELSGQLDEDHALVWRDQNRTLIELPTNPICDTPTHSRIFAAKNDSNEALVRFRWHSEANLLYYQLQVSKLPSFSKRVYDRNDIQNGASDVALGPGEYFWRVRGISSEGVPGAFSSVTKFTVRSSDGAPSSESVREKPTRPGPKIKNVKIEIINNVAIVSGRSAPTAYVTVNGVKAVMSDDGSFSVIVNFVRRGIQWVEIIARDAKGGETVSRHKVKLAF